MKRFFILLLTTILISGINLFAQKRFMNEGVYSDDPINPSSFNNKLFQDLFLYKLNAHMYLQHLEGFEINSLMETAAQEHAEIMAKNQEASLDGKGKYSTIQNRLIAAGGSGIGNELVTRMTIRISNEFITYDELAEQVLSRWTSGKNAKELFSQKYFFAGIYGQVDDTGKKIFISMYIGNYSSYKVDKSEYSKLDVQPTTKTQGLKPFDEQICKRSNIRGLDIVDLQEGLYINENNEIIFKYDDLKSFKKLIKGENDGLSVDIIQKSQFDDCKNPVNIVDYTNVNIGYMLKPTYSKNLYDNNIAEPEGRSKRINKLETVLGQLPAELSEEDVELNLIIIKDKYVCNNITPSYVDKKTYDYTPKLHLIPDTVVFTNVNAYAPLTTSTELKFRIYFEQGKYSYDPKDMKPVLEALNEPSFLINKIFITTYSSLEGNQSENEALQKKRAQSIVKAFEENQNASIVDSIVTAQNLKDLKTDVKGTRFEEVSYMDLTDAIKYVNTHASEMESILKNHRYADIIIWVTYDVDGNKEENFVVDQFNKAIEAKQLDQALAIQKYIMKRVVENVYNEKSVSDMRIPQAKEFVGLNMNKIWMTQYIFMDEINNDYMSKIENLYKLDNSNIYVDYNDVLCKILLTNIENENTQNALQSRIDRLYNTSINVNLIDALNIELQYQVMKLYKDSLGYNHPEVAKSLQKIKDIVHFDDIKWENSLKFATVFINLGDYKYAMQLLEPYAFYENVPLEFLITYVTLCTKIDNKVHSDYFCYALEKINERDNSVFCSLFNDKNKLPVQVFVNTKVKDLYCKNCRK